MNSLAQLLKAATTHATRGMHTCMPGRILSYDDGDQRAEVRPLLGRALNDGTQESLPVLNDVPVIFPRSGGAWMTFPVKAGDGCLLIFSERSLDEWKGSSDEVFPEDNRAFDLSDAVAIMGLNPFGAGETGGDDVVISYGASRVTISDGEIKLAAPSVRIEAATAKIVAETTVEGNLTVTGNMESKGPLNISGPSIRHNGKSIGATHTHSGVQTGGGNTGSPT